jgi:hypothetical protein
MTFDIFITIYLSHSLVAKSGGIVVLIWSYHGIGVGLKAV